MTTRGGARSSEESPSRTEVERVRYLEDLSDALERAGADPQDICITGSAVLALCGVKENPDVDFIAAEPARAQLVDLMARDPDSRHIAGVRGEIGEHLELSIADRLSRPPYLFDLSDDAVVHDERYHLIAGGFKFLRPELLLSMKGAKRRPKDVEDIHRIQDAGLLDEAWWDWDLVHVVPPWDRAFATEEAKDGLLPRDTILHQALDSVSADGVVATLRRGAQMASERLDALREAWFATRRRFGHGFPPPLSEDIEYRYPLPNLLVRQYDEHGRLIWMDPSRGPQDNTETSEDDERIAVTREGRIVRGHGTIDAKLDAWHAELPARAPDRTLPVEVVPTTWPGDEEKQLAPLEGEGKRNRLWLSAACFHAIFWPSLQARFEDAEQLVASEFAVLDVTDLELGGDWPLQRFVETVYSRDERTEEWFVRNRVNKLAAYEPRVRVLTFEVPDPTFTGEYGSRVAREVYERKMAFREEISTWLEDYTYATCIHMTDNFEHNAHIADLVARVKGSKRDPLA